VRTAAIGGVVLLALAAAAMELAGANPLLGFYALLRGALGGPHQIAETLVQTTSLLFPSLAVALAFRAGFFNIGAEGQRVIGGLLAGLLGARLHLPGTAGLPLVLSAGALGGALWGGIAGTLRARFGGNEVVATLMLNVIAALLANYLVVGPLHSPGTVGPETAELAPSLWLPTIVPGTRLTVAMPLGLLVAAGVALLLSRTVFGYELRASGANPQAARRAGIDQHWPPCCYRVASRGSAAQRSSRGCCIASTWR